MTASLDAAEDSSIDAAVIKRIRNTRKAFLGGKDIFALLSQATTEQ